MSSDTEIRRLKEEALIEVRKIFEGKFKGYADFISFIERKRPGVVPPRRDSIRRLLQWDKNQDYIQRSAAEEIIYWLYKKIDKAPPHIDAITIPVKQDIPAAADLGALKKSLVSAPPVPKELAIRRAGIERYIPDGQLVEESKPVITTKTSVAPPVIPLALADHRFIIERHINESLRNFANRNYIYEKLDAFIAEYTCGYFCLVGYPGEGKTAIAAHYVRVWNDHAPYHFVIKGRNGRNDIACFLEDICYQLHAFAADYNYQLEAIHTEAWNNAAYLERLLDDISEHILEQHNTNLVIVVDALDEVTEKPRTSTENLLCLPETLPDNVYLFVTQRPARPERNKGLHPRKLEDIPMFVLDMRDEWNRENEEGLQPDLKGIKDSLNQYITTFLDGKVRDRSRAKGNDDVLGSKLQERLNQVTTDGSYSVDEFRIRLIQASVGNFLYLVYVLADMANGLYPVDLRDDNISQLPDGLKGQYSNFIERLDLTPSEWEIIYITALFASPRNNCWASISMIARAASQDTLTVRELIVKRCGEYFRQITYQDGSEDEYWVYHLSFREHLEDELDIEEKTLKTRDQIGDQIDLARIPLGVPNLFEKNINL